MPLIACEHADKLQLCGRESWVSLCTCVCVCGEGCGGRCAGQTFNLAQMQKLFASQRPRGPCLPSLFTKRSRYEWACVCVCVAFALANYPSQLHIANWNVLRAWDVAACRVAASLRFLWQAVNKHATFVLQQAKSCQSEAPPPPPPVYRRCSATAIITHSIFALRCLHQIAYTQRATTQTVGKCLLVMWFIIYFPERECNFVNLKFCLGKKL